MNVTWQSMDGKSAENLSLDFSENEVIANSVIVNKSTDGFIAQYSIVCDALWVARKLTLEVEQQGKKKFLRLESDGKGNWTSNSQALSYLNGAIDIDLSATPFTNTLPINRLNLKENQTKEIQVVYVTIPELDVSLKTQRYTCKKINEKYLFEQPSDNFKQEILVDQNGLVLLYPDLFKRVNC